MSERHLTDAILAAIPADGSATTIEIALKTSIERIHCARLLAQMESVKLVISSPAPPTYRWRRVAQLPQTECENEDLINS